MLDRERILQIVEAAGRNLQGEWVLLGGALVALWTAERRLTEDVDLVGLKGSADERYALMDLADALGLPVEAVNSAADYFLRRIPGWEEMLVVLHAGPSAIVHRPDATLFILTKIGRLSERDLEDCLLALKQAPSEVDADRIRAALDDLPEPEGDAAARRDTLRAALHGDAAPE